MGSHQTVALPSIGDYKDVPVIEILVKPGHRVGVDTPLLILEFDKATLEVPSPYAGRVVEVMANIGRKVSEGLPVAVIEVEGAGTPTTPAEAAPPPAAASPPAAPAPAPVTPATAKSKGRNSSFEPPCIGVEIGFAEAGDQRRSRLQ